MTIELNPVDRITADAVGAPGERTFFIQARGGDQLVTVLVEKEQVQLLAASVVEILARIQRETGEGPSEETMGLEEPVVPEWRAGRLSIGYQEERDLLVLEAVELLPEDETEDEDESDDGDEDEDESEDREEEGEEEGSAFGAEPETIGLELLDEPDVLEALEQLEEIEQGELPRSVRFWATREQMLSLARHGAAVCAQGRPTCQLCGLPIDPEGHQCPALNGHREFGA